MKINIVGGNGVMGRIHKNIFEKYGHEVIISGRTSVPSMIDSAKMSDITIISVPIDAVESTIKKVAPYCKAIADFTSLKEFAVNAMLKYSKDECEVIGIHPLYGNVDSIKDRTVIVCHTQRSGKICSELMKCFEKESAKIIEMDAKSHDKKVSAVNQNLRIKMLTAFLSMIKSHETNFSESYELSPPPTKNIIELLARQLKHENDHLYFQLLKGDKYAEEIESEFIKNFLEIKKDYKKYAKNLREFIGKDLENLSEKAKKKIE